MFEPPSAFLYLKSPDESTLDEVRKAVILGKLNVNKNGQEHTPLSMAAFLGNEDAAALFIKLGAKIDEVNKYIDFNKRPIDFALENPKKAKNVVRLLLQKGANINCDSKSAKFHALQQAILSNDLELIKLVFANIQKQNIDDPENKWLNDFSRNGKSILDYAVETNNIEIIDYVTGINVAAKLSDNSLLLLLNQQNPDLLNQVLAVTKIDLNRSLKFEGENKTILEFLASEETTEFLDICLKHSIERINSDVLETYYNLALANRNIQLIKVLIQHGANINGMEEKSLLIAIENNDEVFVRLLLDKISFESLNKSKIYNHALKYSSDKVIDTLKEFKMETDDKISSIPISPVAIISSDVSIKTIEQDGFENKLKIFLENVYKQTPNDQSWEQLVLLMKYLNQEIDKQSLLTNADDIANFEKACNAMLKDKSKLILNTKSMLEHIVFLLLSDESNSKDLKEQALLDLIEPLSKCQEGAQGEIQSKYVLLKDGSLGELLRAFAKSTIEQGSLNYEKNIHVRNNFLWIARYIIPMRILGHIQKDKYRGGNNEIELMSAHVRNVINSHCNIENFIESSAGSILSNLLVSKIVFSQFDEYQREVLKSLKIANINPEELNNIFTCKINIPYLILAEILDSIGLAQIYNYKFLLKEPDNQEVKNMGLNDLWVVNTDNKILFIWRGKKYEITKMESDPDLYNKLLSINQNNLIEMVNIFNQTKIGNTTEIGSPYIEVNKEYLEYKLLIEMEKDGLLKAAEKTDNISDGLGKKLPNYHPIKVMILPNVECIVYKTYLAGQSFYLKDNVFIREEELLKDPRILTIYQNYSPTEFLKFINENQFSEKLTKSLLESSGISNIDIVNEYMDFNLNSGKVNWYKIFTLASKYPKEFLDWCLNPSNILISSAMFDELGKHNNTLAVNFFKIPSINESLTNEHDPAHGFILTAFNILNSNVGNKSKSMQMLLDVGMKSEAEKKLNLLCSEILSKDAAKVRELVYVLEDFIVANYEFASDWIKGYENKETLFGIMERSLYDAENFIEKMAKNFDKNNPFVKSLTLERVRYYIRNSQANLLFSKNDKHKDYNLFMLDMIMGSRYKFDHKFINSFFPQYEKLFHEWMANNFATFTKSYFSHLRKRYRRLNYDDSNENNSNENDLKSLELSVVKFVYSGIQTDAHQQLVKSFERSLSNLSSYRELLNVAKLRYIAYPTYENLSTYILQALSIGIDLSMLKQYAPTQQLSEILIKQIRFDRGNEKGIFAILLVGLSKDPERKIFSTEYVGGLFDYLGESVKANTILRFLKYAAKKSKTYGLHSEAIIPVLLKDWSKYSILDQIVIAKYLVTQYDFETFKRIFNNLETIKGVINSLNEAAKPKPVKLFGITLYVKSNTQIISILKVYQLYYEEIKALSSDAAIEVAEVSQVPQESSAGKNYASVASIEKISQLVPIKFSVDPLMLQGQVNRIRLAVTQSFFDNLTMNKSKEQIDTELNQLLNKNTSASVNYESFDDLLYNFSNIAAKMLTSQNPDFIELITLVAKDKINLPDFFRAVLTKITGLEHNELSTASTMHDIAVAIIQNQDAIDKFKFISKKVEPVAKPLPQSEELPKTQPEEPSKTQPELIVAKPTDNANARTSTNNDMPAKNDIKPFVLHSKGRSAVAANQVAKAPITFSNQGQPAPKPQLQLGNTSVQALRAKFEKPPIKPHQGPKRES